MADNCCGLNAPKPFRLTNAYYASTKMKGRAVVSESTSFEIHSDPFLINYNIDWIQSQALQDKLGFQANHHAAVTDLHNNVPKINAASALIPSEQYQVALLDGESLEDVDIFKYFDSTFIASGRATEIITNTSNIAHSAFSRLKSCISGVNVRYVQ